MRRCNRLFALSAWLIFTTTALMPSPTQAATRFRVVHTFTGGTDGAGPEGTLAFDASGDLFGVTSTGGTVTKCSNGCGVVFELIPTTSGGWRNKVIYKFTGGSDGANPYGGVVIDRAGNVFGTTTAAGKGCGTVFELTPGATSWKEKTLYQFANQPDGCEPTSVPVLDAAGNLYGTTAQAGPSNAGIVFQLAPEGMEVGQRT